MRRLICIVRITSWSALWRNMTGLSWKGGQTIYRSNGFAGILARSHVCLGTCSHACQSFKPVGALARGIGCWQLYGWLPWIVQRSIPSKVRSSIFMGNTWKRIMGFSKSDGISTFDRAWGRGPARFSKFVHCPWASGPRWLIWARPLSNLLDNSAFASRAWGWPCRWRATMPMEPHIAASQLITRRLEYVSPRSTLVVSIPKLQVEKARPRRYLIGRKRDQCWILPKHDIQRFHLMLYRNIRRETVTPESELDQYDDHESWRSHSSSHWGKERFSLWSFTIQCSHQV